MAALIRSLRQLSELHLNGYPLHKDKISSSLGFEYQRDHVYQVRPSHDLASMTMDLSKEPTQRLKVPFVLLCSILDQLNYLHTLCIQYQDLAAQQQHGSFDFSAFCHIQHLDISSCMIDQATLQAMFRKIGPRLKTLKMLNIDLSSLSWLCLSQFGKQLTCLHVSCNDPALLFNIRHVVLHLKTLQDFRLTRLRTGEIDSVVHQLNPHVLERLDLSPKMNIYPKAMTRYPSTKQPGATLDKTTQQTPTRSTEADRDEAEPTQIQSERVRHYATIEHDLLLSDASLHYLSQCHHLIELRLCFPKVSAQALHQLLSSLPRLEVVELRQRKEQQEDCLTGLMNSKTLKELYLFGVWISEETIERITQTESNILASLRHLTVSGGGRMIESNIEKLLVSLQSLHTFCLGQIEGPIEWKSYVFDDRRNLTFSKDRQNQWYLA
ncbi:hypothetical protein EDC96DRAFT_586717 [Choanephora cucurbitarum]|nr:hypothetical protein EDC96DRAFT_586717 [Choanephora cucurbitarum]